MTGAITIENRPVGRGHPALVVAELSANHGQKIDAALELIGAARDAGADAIKVQTYTADTMTLDSDAAPFVIGDGSPWTGRRLYELYQEAYTPWEWLPELQTAAREAGLIFFSTAFDPTSVETLEQLDVPVHKLASFEIVDIPLIECVARTGKPLILSTGMATEEEIDDAVSAARSAGTESILLLKCTSAYPAPAEKMNLAAIPRLAERFSVPVGLSDHSLDDTAAVAAVSLGACLVEKHFTLDRGAGGPDSSFSVEPHEFRRLVDAIRTTEAATTGGALGVSEAERGSTVFRRSLFVVRDVAAGEEFTTENVRSIRPGYGMAPKELPAVLGRKAGADIASGTPLAWDLVASDDA